MAKVTPLTNTEVKQAKPKGTAYKLSDGGGLQLRIRPNGTKTWLLDYLKPFTKKRTSLSFGSYPDISLADARKKRQEAKDLLAENIDPKSYREEQALAITNQLNNTLESVAASWLKIYKTKVKAKTADNCWNSLNTYIFPKLGKRAITSIRAKETIDIIQVVADKGSLELVSKLCQRLNAIMTFALNTGLAETNPLAGIKKAFETPTVTNLPTIQPNELPELLTRLNNSNMKLITRHLIYWQLHTMVRSSEAAGAKWEEIDFKNSLWIIPAERMKMNRQHTVPLTTQALAILSDIKPLSGDSEYIFPADQLSRQINKEAANKALRKLGYKNKLVAHGLRSLASTTLNEQGFDADVIESALAHVDKNEVRRAYNRAEYLERRRKLMYWWSEYIEQAHIGKSNKFNKGLQVVS
ncbi:integrase domain-containing protein [Pseudocolwellia sp. AS88]|uniref:integrase domain-containing protein n=1 Tax=Pseudocolwellia sp. AS88 TaxID=3063958 RepID=UPI0026E94A07|nr:integrase domain-containing protein [Pseudocolwellia sp. AS88]MDO7084013.1 integrase domain-containing protein [Pseudocolwellia sp. AS88]